MRDHTTILIKKEISRVNWAILGVTQGVIVGKVALGHADIDTRGERGLERLTSTTHRTSLVLQQKLSMQKIKNQCETSHQKYAPLTLSSSLASPSPCSMADDKKVRLGKKVSASPTRPRVPRDEESIFFSNPDVAIAFQTYLSDVFKVNEGAIAEVFKGFEEFIMAFYGGKKRSEIREEIVQSFKEVFGSAIDRYSPEDILGWISPFPLDSIERLCVHTINRVRNLEIVSPSWELDENKLNQLGNVLWIRIVRKLADTDAWNLAYRIKDHYQLGVSARELVNFISQRRKPFEVLDRKKLLNQIASKYKFKTGKLPEWV